MRAGFNTIHFQTRREPNARSWYFRVSVFLPGGGIYRGHQWIAWTKTLQQIKDTSIIYPQVPVDGMYPANNMYWYLYFVSLKLTNTKACNRLALGGSRSVMIFLDILAAAPVKLYILLRQQLLLHSARMFLLFFAFFVFSDVGRRFPLR